MQYIHIYFTVVKVYSVPLWLHLILGLIVIVTERYLSGIFLIFVSKIGLTLLMPFASTLQNMSAKYQALAL